MTEEAKTITTSVFAGILEAWFEKKRRVFLEGGTWSSKTYSTLQFLKFICENTTEPLTVSVVSESVPHLKRGVIRDFETIMGDALVQSRWNLTDNIYDFVETGSKMEFFSADKPAKLRGGRRDILFVNEANNVAWMAFRELDSRTRLFTICDWNPVSEFWYHQRELGNEKKYPENVYIHSTYLDALDVIPQAVKDDIDASEDRDPNWFRIYGLGLLGKIEGLVYPFFEQVEKLPAGDVFYGLDLGFIVDPTVLTAHVVITGDVDKLYSHQVFYDDTRLTNDEIGRLMRKGGVKMGRDQIFADPSSAQAIEELRRMGFNIKEAMKGHGSVEYGIQRVNQFDQYWTEESLECIKEQRNFRYIVGKDETLSDDTTHRWSHGMASRRYAVTSYDTGVTERPRTGRSNFSFSGRRRGGMVDLKELLKGSV